MNVSGTTREVAFFALDTNSLRGIRVIVAVAPDGATRLESLRSDSMRALASDIAATASLQFGWDDDGSAPAPSAESRAMAQRVLETLATLGLIADEAGPDASGGVTISFYRSTRWVDVMARNTGSLLISFDDRANTIPVLVKRIDERELSTAVLEMERFLNGRRH